MKKWLKKLFPSTGGKVTPSYISPPPPRKPSICGTLEVGCIAKAIIEDLEKDGWVYAGLRLKSGPFYGGFGTLQHPTIQYQIPWSGHQGQYEYLYTFDGDRVKYDFNPLEQEQLGKACQNTLHKISHRAAIRERLEHEKKLKEIFPQCYE